MPKDKKINEEETPEIIEDVEEVVEETIEEPNDLEYIVGKITADTSYMRKEPIKTSSINLILRKRDVVIIDKNGDIGNYYKVTAQTKVGYVLKNDVVIE